MRSLRTQLLLSHILLVVLMAAVMGSALWSLRGIEAISRGRVGNSRASRGAQIIDSSLVEQRTSLWLLMADSPSEAKITNDASWNDYATGFTLIHSQGVSEGVAAAADVLAANIRNYKTLSDKVLKANELSLQPGTEGTVKTFLEPRIAALRQQAVQLENEAMAASSLDGEAAREASDTTIARTGWVTLIGIFLAFGLGIRLVRAAILPLHRLVNRAERIAEGDLTAEPMIDRHDEIGALSKAIELMTERIREARRLAQKRLQRAEQMSDAALEHLYDPVVVLDQKGRIVHLNQAAEELLGKIPDESKVPVKEHIQDRRLSKALLQAASAPGPKHSEDETESLILPFRGDKKVYRLRTTIMKDDDGVPLGSVAVLEDITHFRELDRLKNEFIGVASHELRTPVSSLLLSAQLLKDGAIGELTSGQQEIIDIQLQDLERLEKLMKDLLDVTKLEAGMKAPHLETVKVSDVISTTVTFLASQAAKQDVALVPAISEDLGTVQADQSQIGRVLTNLIANAIRHTGPQGTVTVGAHAALNEVTFYVQDTGEGIPPDYLARIFDRFVQVPGATQGGAGLGLSIAQNIVKAHHGFMAVESEVGKGSVFRFTIPRVPKSSGREL